MVEEDFKGGWGGMRSPEESGEQKLSYCKLNQCALHSSQCFWELLTLLANSPLAWVN